MAKKNYADGGMPAPTVVTTPGGPVPSGGRLGASPFEAARRLVSGVEQAAQRYPRMFGRRPADQGPDMNRRRTSPGGSGSMGVMVGEPNPGMKKGGKVKSASSRADGIASKGKTKGKIY